MTYLMGFDVIGHASLPDKIDDAVRVIFLREPVQEIDSALIWGHDRTGKMKILHLCLYRLSELRFNNPQYTGEACFCESPQGYLKDLSATETI